MNYEWHCSIILLLRRKGDLNCWINKISIFENFEFMFSGILNFADFRPPWYGLWYCGSVYCSILVYKFNSSSAYTVYLNLNIKFMASLITILTTQANTVVNNWSVFFKRYCKVHIFWEGHKNFAKSPPYFWLALHRTKVRWRFRNILWPSQNIWTLSQNMKHLLL